MSGGCSVSSMSMTLTVVFYGCIPGIAAARGGETVVTVNSLSCAGVVWTRFATPCPSTETHHLNHELAINPKPVFGKCSSVGQVRDPQAWFRRPHQG